MKHVKPIALVTAASAALVVAAVSFRAPLASAAAHAPPVDGVTAGACNDQPNMAAALAQLRAARASLNGAEHNKGGWRDNAEKATDNAIAETTRGCAFPR
jgi:hypothetical protein